MEKFGGEIGRKYASIDQVGRKAINSNEIVEFNISENFKDRFNLSVFLKNSSEENLKNNVLNRISAIGDMCNLNLFLAGRDFPIHVSILEGLFTDSDEGEESYKKREVIFNELKNDRNLHEEVSRLLDGQILEFKYLLIDKGNIILTSVDIPECVIKARKLLSDRYTEANLKPLMMSNILHLTVSRISKLPEDKNLLLTYKEELVKLRHSISANPLLITVNTINVESSYDLLTKI